MYFTKGVESVGFLITININSIEIKTTSKIPGAKVLKQFQSFLCGVDDHS